MVCNGDYTPMDGKCDGKSCDIGDCEACNNVQGKENCFLCDWGLVVYSSGTGDDFKSECIMGNGKTLNCRTTLHDNKNICSECLPNYYYYDGECLVA